MGVIRKRAVHSPEKTVILRRVVGYLSKCDTPVRAADIAKRLAISRSAIDNIIITLTYYESRFYETDDGKYGLNNELVGKYINLPYLDRDETYTVNTIAIHTA